MFAPPCSTCSRALRQPMRSYKHIYGLPDLSAKNQIKVSNANKCYLATARLVRSLHRKGRPWIIENPHTSFMWWMPEIYNLQWLPRVHPYVIDQCMYGTPWRKRTLLLCGNISLDDMQWIKQCKTARGGICSRTGQPHIRLSGKGPDGVSLTSKAARYPLKLARSLASVLVDTMGNIYEMG